MESWWCQFYFRLLTKGPSKNNVQLHSESCPDAADGSEAKLEVFSGWPQSWWCQFYFRLLKKELTLIPSDTNSLSSISVC